MKATELVDYMEKNYKVHSTVGKGHLAPTGRPYVTLVLGGEKAEGDSIEPPFCRTAIDAVKAFKRTFDEWAKAQSGKSLYWRVYPSIKNHKGHFTIRARLLIG